MSGDPSSAAHPFTESEFRELMSCALVESRHALPRCAPNPPVGCIISRGTHVLATGYTGAPGEPHAEAAALRNLGADVSREDLTLFVTLEPCAFVGRTPSCARAIVDAGIRRVIVGTLDPDPRNNGAGIAIMRQAGIDVQLGVLEDDVLTFISAYLWHRAGV